MSEHFRTRLMCERDRAFVFRSWLESYRQEGYAVRRVKPRIFFKGHHRVIERILSRPTVSVHIAHMTTEPDVIFGYLVTEFTDEFIVHYAFTKEAFRLSGIQRALLKASGAPEKFLASHWTRSVDFALSPQEKIEFDPYRA